MEDPIFTHAKNTIAAIRCLRDAGHLVPALMLTYAAIDQMSWLSISDDINSGKDFKSWVTQYMLTDGKLECDANDLWAARNGLLHMGTAESKDSSNGKAKRICYSYGDIIPKANSDPNEVYLNVEKLISAYLVGVIYFMNDLENTPVNRECAHDKLSRILIATEL